MNEQTGLSDRYRKASPWPMFVALGLALSEVGVFINIFPVAVFGLFLFVGSVAGILTESGYTQRPWPTMAGLGVFLAVVAGLVILWYIPLEAVSLAEFGQDGILSRSLSVLTAGIILALAGGVAALAEPAKA